MVTVVGLYLTILLVIFACVNDIFYLYINCILIFFKWEGTIKSITQVYLHQIKLKYTNNCNKQTVTCILLSVKKYIQSITIYK